MSDAKIVAASILKFLNQQLTGEVKSEYRESVEISIQCLETAFELSPEEKEQGVDLLQLLRQQRSDAAPNREKAEKLKNEGNELMKAEKYREALEKYSKAIEIDPNNAVYFSNRAASHFKLGENQLAIADCRTALTLQPNYGKAHGRLGLALTAMNRHREARDAFARAVEIEPDNESYKENLRLAEEQVAQRGELNQLNLGGLFQNPALLNMATEMLADPNMQNMISGLMSNTNASTIPPVEMNTLLQAGQALTEYMHTVNPELVGQMVGQLRRTGQGDNPQPQPPSQ